MGNPPTGGGREEEAGGDDVRRGREVTWVITHQATGPDGGRDGTLRNSKGGASHQDQAHKGRKGPLQRVSKERPYEEVPEVLARDSGSL